jgi:glutamyl-tRNA synthetase
MTQVVVRFAPSPTGKLHIGSARTAIYNWLYARHTGGKMLLRIEDTDLERSTEENVQVIVNGLRWLGIDWDEEPVFQSKRVDLYRPLIDKLIADGKAYRCVCTKEELDEKRTKAMAEKRKALYDRTCRDKNHGPDCGPHTVRLAMPTEGDITFNDVILGEITTSALELDDWIIARSGGAPTYNFVVVADDHDMRVTHVIRGADHINNTPKQLMVYQALGYEPPAFAHMPLTHGPDGKKLSKRHGASSVMEFKTMGYLPEAMRNYFVRLGWGHKEQELFSNEELIGLFDIADVNASPGIMDMKKLDWTNSQKMMTMPVSELAELWHPFLAARGYEVGLGPWLEKLVVNVRERNKNFVEMTDYVGFFFEDPKEYQAKAVKKWLKPGSAQLLREIIEKFETLDDFNEATLEKQVNELCEAKEVGLGKVAQPLRIALTGSAASPGIFETLNLIGKENVLRRLRRAADFATQRETEV